jgi:hypothetical protein
MQDQEQIKIKKDLDSDVTNIINDIEKVLKDNGVIPNLPNTLYNRKLLNTLKYNKKYFDKVQINSYINRIILLSNSNQFTAIYLFFTSIKIILLFSDYYRDHDKFLSTIRGKFREVETLSSPLKKHFNTLYQSIFAQFSQTFTK